MEAPVALDPDIRDTGYLLGRLFAVYEQVQTAALGHGVNATIKDKFYGAAAAQPRKVFRAARHAARPTISPRCARTIAAGPSISTSLSPASWRRWRRARSPFPRSLPDKSQALFALGYYHQRNAFFRKAEKAADEDQQP